MTLALDPSHATPAAVTMTRAMIRAARQAVLSADHTTLDQDPVVQVAPINVVHELITDNAIPASIRLDSTKTAVDIILATT